jgi:hypothetical protein
MVDRALRVRVCPIAAARGAARFPRLIQKRQRAGALQDASRVEKGLEHASAFGVRQSSAAFHSGPVISRAPTTNY